ncbi:MAG: hypothetical protein LBL62_09355 [Planctomycetaceae bacterium]|nr:hypothetical protein [Planctomycetaceae bacterium]
MEPILSTQMMEPSRIIKMVAATEIIPIKTDNGDTKHLTSGFYQFECPLKESTKK